MYTIIGNRNEKIFRFICKFKKEHDGCSPSIAEIGEACKISSTSVVNYHLRDLAVKGRIVFLGKRGAARGIAVVGGEWKYSGGEAPHD